MKVFKELVPSWIQSRKLRLRNGKELSANSQKNIPVIISLTSFGNRIKKVDIAVRSLLKQTYLPEQIILNIHHSHKDKVSRELEELAPKIFSINYVDEDLSHMKLIPSLKKFPHKIIVTIDDDVIYPIDLLEKLYAEHLRYPMDIIANHIRVITKDSNGNLKPYKEWAFDGSTDESKSILALGFGGVLYPPNVFSDEVFDSSKYQKLAPKADDLWFKAIALLNDIRIRPLEIKPKRMYPIIGTQNISLKSQNVKEDRNRETWEKLVSYYQLEI